MISPHSSGAIKLEHAPSGHLRQCRSQNKLQDHDHHLLHQLRCIQSWNPGCMHTLHVQYMLELQDNEHHLLHPHLCIQSWSPQLYTHLLSPWEEVICPGPCAAPIQPGPRTVTR